MGDRAIVMRVFKLIGRLCRPGSFLEISCLSVKMARGLRELLWEACRAQGIPDRLFNQVFPERGFTHTALMEELVLLLCLVAQEFRSRLDAGEVVDGGTLLMSIRHLAHGHEWDTRGLPKAPIPDLPRRERELPLLSLPRRTSGESEDEEVPPTKWIALRRAGREPRRPKAWRLRRPDPLPELGR